MAKVKIIDLKLGDKIQTFEGAYSTATVIRITYDRITLFRPYVHTSNVEYSNGLIPYIGFEEYYLYPTDQLINRIEKGGDVI